MPVIFKGEKRSMDEIMEKLLEIFKARFDRDLSERYPEIQDEHLLGSKLGMEPRHLIYLFFDIEREFGITIPEEQIISCKFSSLSNIARMIQHQLEINGIFIGGAKVS
jgi:peptide maturation system acyl carrier-related protein